MVLVRILSRRVPGLQSTKRCCRVKVPSGALSLQYEPHYGTLGNSTSFSLGLERVLCWSVTVSEVKRG